MIIGFASAQKEVYFNNVPLDSIKVHSIHGVELKWTMDILSTFYYKFDTYSSAIPLYVGYFSEKGISSSWSLKTNIGLQNFFYKSLIQHIDSIKGNYYYSSTNNTFRNSYSLMLEGGIEPRWHWRFKERYQNGKATLNSGGFLSFPFALRTTLLETPDQIFYTSWFPKYFSITASFTPSIGYRQAISKRIFVEGSFGVGLQSVIGQNYYKRISITSPNIFPQINIKAAYTFK